jgi:hypothetical protein
VGIILIFREVPAIFYHYGSRAEFTFAVGMCGFVSLMAAHMYGTLAFIWATEFALVNSELVPSFFIALVPIVAVERLVLTIITTLLGVPIILSLRGKLLISQPLVVTEADLPPDLGST